MTSIENRTCGSDALASPECKVWALPLIHVIVRNDIKLAATSRIADMTNRMSTTCGDVARYAYSYAASGRPVGSFQYLLGPLRRISDGARLFEVAAS